MKRGNKCKKKYTKKIDKTLQSKIIRSNDQKNFG